MIRGVLTATREDPAARRQRVRVGLWGLFDTGDADGPTVRAVLDAELHRRVPGLDLGAYSPLGQATARDGGRTPEVLGEPSDERVGELAGALDCVVVAGALPLDATALAAAYGRSIPEASAALLLRGLGETGEQRCPLAWHGVMLIGTPAGLAARTRAPALLSVRDATSLAALLESALAGEAVSVPHHGILLARAVRDDALRRRVETWRGLDVLPAQGVVLLVDAAALAGPTSSAALAALRDVAADSGINVVVVDAGPPSGAAAVPAPVAAARRLPGGAGVADIAAAASVATLVLSATPVLSAVAAGYGRTVVALPGASATGDAGVPGETTADVDGIADALRRALRSPAPPPPSEAIAVLDGELDRLARWITARTSAAARAPRQKTPQASRDARRLTELRRALLGEIGELQARIAALEAAHAAELQELRDELQRWRETAQRVTTSKTWRYTESARTLYRQLRERTPR
jgi:hypothetical protein